MNLNQYRIVFYLYKMQRVKMQRIANLVCYHLIWRTKTYNLYIQMMNIKLYIKLKITTKLGAALVVNVLHLRGRTRLGPVFDSQWWNNL